MHRGQVLKDYKWKGILANATPIQIAWAAGLFEGEGSITMRLENPKGFGSSIYERVVLQLSMTDQDVVKRFAAIVGGTVHEQTRANKPSWKPLYYWSIEGTQHVEDIIEAFWPYLGERRKATAIDLAVDPEY
jgi:hypothetical protein